MSAEPGPAETTLSLKRFRLGGEYRYALPKIVWYLGWNLQPVIGICKSFSGAGRKQLQDFGRRTVLPYQFQDALLFSPGNSLSDDRYVKLVPAASCNEFLTCNGGDHRVPSPFQKEDTGFHQRNIGSGTQDERHSWFHSRDELRDYHGTPKMIKIR